MTDASVADNYDVATPIEHILLKPGMYAGSPDLLTESMYIMEDEAITQKVIEYIPALQRLYEEILLNAFDQTVREGTGCTEIHVDIDPNLNTISVYNNGQGIPVVHKEKTNCYVPEMVFGMLCSGSNLKADQVRITGGTNGLGAKLANIFSTRFQLETADSDRKKLYKQEWCNNMSEKSDPKITALGKKKPYTKITFSPDLKYFNINQLTADMIALMKKRLVDIGFASHSKIKTFFNGNEITIKRTEDYMKRYDSDQETFLVDTSCERWTVGIALSTNGFGHISFVNGIHTSLGGSHVDHVMGIITKEVIEKLKSKKIEVRPSDVKNKLRLFLKSTIENPIFDSQTKECLKMSKIKFGSEYIMSDAFKRKLLSSDLLKQLSNVSEAKLLKDLSKTSGTKTSRITGIATLEDANWAGTTKSNQTRLILTEGLSAKTFAMSAITVIGRDRFGIFPLKGKLLNVRGAPLEKISENKEICALVKILGLKYSEKYSDTSSLRYGGVIALTDSDHDGSHICALIVNLFHYFWPELLQLGYLGFCATPIVKIYQKSNTLAFYTINEYEAWLEQNTTSTFKTKYFKGLGTSTAAEAREALCNIDDKIISFQTDDQVVQSVNLAFNKKLTDDRKLWLMERYNPKDNIDRSIQEVPVSDYINKELIHFSYYSNQRAVAHVMDGLKPSQRKILHTAIKYISTTEMKVAQFGAKVAEKTDYHHGEESLMGAVVGMAQNYVGSNNINLLEPIGAFGSRLSNGADAASPRYICTKLQPIAKILFDTRDASLLTYLESDGTVIEPEWFAPVIPMVLVNGTEGIGTGFSTNVLKFNPEDLCRYLISLLNDEKPTKNLKPWYRGFTGMVERLASNKYETIGRYTFDDSKNAMIITELPIGVWTDDYKTFIEELLVNDEWIRDVRYGNSDVIVHFELIFTPKAYALVKELSTDELRKRFKLSSKLSGTNMHLFNHNGMLTKYNNVYEIIKEFYLVRLELYEKRRAAIIATLEYEQMILANKVKFIRHVKAGQIKLQSIADATLLTYLVDHGFDQNNGIYGKPNPIPTLKEFAYLIDMPIRSLTNENAAKFQQLYDDKQIELDRARKQTAKDMWQLDLRAVSVANQADLRALAETNASSPQAKDSGKKKRTVKKRTA